MNILVTGGTGILGKEIVQGLLSDGHHALIVTRDSKKARSIFGRSSKISFIELNLSTPTADSELLQKIQEEDVNIDFFIHAARSLDSLKVESDGTTESMSFLSEFNLQVVVPYRIVLGLMKYEGLKGYIGIGSMYGDVTFNKSLYGTDLAKAPIQYSVSKAALNHLTQELAVRFPHLKINQVSYGGIEGRVGEDFIHKYAGLCPLGRMMDKSEIYGPIRFLMSMDSNYVQGQIINVDGGWQLW